MAARIHLARWTALCAATWMFLAMGHEAWAGPHLRALTSRRVYTTGNDCPPKAVTFGYYDANWRQWPAQQRPDRTFPQSIGAERLMTPQGVEQVPLPVERFVPEGGQAPPSGPRLPTDLPPDLPAPEVPIPPGLGSPLEPPPGMPGNQEILPPDREIRIDERSPLGEQPGPPSPLEPLPAETLPGLPLEPATPPGREVPAESRLPGIPAPEPGPGAGGLPMLPGVLPGEQPPMAPPVTEPPVAKPPAPETDEGARWLDETSPAPAETIPLPVEPWAEPRPWQPEPARKATYEAPWSRPRPWQQPAERPAEPAFQQEVPPPLEPAMQPALEPQRQRPIEAPAQQTFTPPAELPVQPLAPEVPKVEASPLGLDGYCPVRLAEGEEWVAGEECFAAKFNGRTYMMSDQARQQRFLGNPTRYAPVMGGNDPVLSVDENSSVPGQTEFCVVYDGRLYMFSDAGTLARFHQNPKRYSSVATRAAY